MSRSMPIATRPACRFVPGHINAKGEMICGCCHRVVGDTGLATDSPRFEQD